MAGTKTLKDAFILTCYDVVVREDSNKYSKPVAYVEPFENVEFIGHVDNHWDLIRTSDGTIGFIEAGIAIARTSA